MESNCARSALSDMYIDECLYGLWLFIAFRKTYIVRR